MKQLLLRIFTWWNGATVGTLWFTRRKGRLVGTDEFGNRYYQANVPPLGDRRWVVYAGIAEASRIPPGWHGWIHHTVDVAPPQENYLPREWQKAPQPNLTGTPAAYRPEGSTLSRGHRKAPLREYEPWTPAG
ncbi:MAG TPA: NADH:ubiquinone oxidoreductase subunit NDUFA12 [Hyphomicrobiales bacterium]|nr:NADH:ubiquinone oxidoreductase subunit NDUFA12 [Hyphomicrobiales bacterium]